MNAIITFEDHGQDFLTWHIERNKVVDCWPFQQALWSGSRIHPDTILMKGGHVQVRVGTKEWIHIKYPLTSVKLLPDAFGYEVEVKVKAGVYVKLLCKARGYRAACAKGLKVPTAVEVTKVTPLDKAAYALAKTSAKEAA